MLHGIASNSRGTWTKFAEHLPDYRLVAIDAYGHGSTPARRICVGVECFAADIAEAIPLLCSRPPIVVGFSLGGVVAQVLARDAPEACSGVVLASTAARVASSLADRMRLRVYKGAGAALRPVPNSLVAGALEFGRGIPLVRRLAFANPNELDWATVFDVAAQLESFDSRQWLGDLRPPLALIITTDDEVIPLRKQEELVGLADFRCVERVTWRHDAVIAHSEAYARLLRAALARLDAST